MSAAISKDLEAGPCEAQTSSARQRDRLRALAVGGCVIAGAAAAVLSAPETSRSIDPELVTLMRGMALIKTLLVLPMAALSLWRFRLAVAAPFAAGYLLSLWSVTVATVLIWKLEHIIAAALLFHMALFAFLILALRDESLMPERLRSAWRR